MKCMLVAGVGGGIASCAIGRKPAKVMCQDCGRERQGETGRSGQVTPQLGALIPLHFPWWQVWDVVKSRCAMG